MNKLLATVLVTGLFCGIANMASAQGSSPGTMVPKADTPDTTIVVKETPTIQPDGSQQRDLDERRATEAEDLIKAAKAKVAGLTSTNKAAQVTSPGGGTQVQAAPPTATAAPATIAAAKAADKVALDAIAAAKATVLEANTAKAALVKALNSGNAEVITKAAAEFETKDKAAVAAVNKSKEAVTAAKQAAKAAGIVIVEDANRTVKDRKDLPVVSKIETVRPVEDDKCDADCMVGRGYTQRVVKQRDQRVRRDHLCYGEEEIKTTATGASITVCNKTQVSVVTAGTVDDDD
jgi:hypothetical protein